MTAEYMPQVEVILERLDKNLESSWRTGDHLDGKAATLLQASSIVTGLTGLVAIPAFVSAPAACVLSDPSTCGDVLALAAAFATFVGMIVCALIAWWPSSFSYPGGADWDTAFHNYVAKEMPDLKDQLLADTLEALRLSRERNRWKSRMVRISCGLFALQIIGLFFVAFLAQ